MASKSTEKMVWRPNVVKAYLHPLIVKAWHKYDDWLFRKPKNCVHSMSAYRAEVACYRIETREDIDGGAAAVQHSTRVSECTENRWDSGVRIHRTRTVSIAESTSRLDL